MVNWSISTRFMSVQVWLAVLKAYTGFSSKNKGEAPRKLKLFFGFALRSMLYKKKYIFYSRTAFQHVKAPATFIKLRLHSTDISYLYESEVKKNVLFLAS